MSEPTDTREEVAFDPEKVERWEWSDDGSLDRCDVVSAENYDKLLAVNREQKAEIERLKACTQLHNDSAVEAWQLTQKWQKRVFDLEAEKRASVGEKPEDAYKRGQEDMMKRVILPSFHSSYPPTPYVAPTLPREEK